VVDRVISIAFDEITTTLENTLPLSSTPFLGVRKHRNNVPAQYIALHIGRQHAHANQVAINYCKRRHTALKPHRAQSGNENIY